MIRLGLLDAMKKRLNYFYLGLGMANLKYTLV